MVKGSADTGETAPADVGMRQRIIAQASAADSGRFTLLDGLLDTAHRNDCGHTSKALEHLQLPRRKGGHSHGRGWQIDWLPGAGILKGIDADR